MVSVFQALQATDPDRTCRGLLFDVMLTGLLYDYLRRLPHSSHRNSESIGFESTWQPVTRTGRQGQHLVLGATTSLLLWPGVLCSVAGMRV